MTAAEVAKYAYITTYTNDSTTIIFKNGTKVSGYFEGNRRNSQLEQANKWNFVVFPQPKNERRQTTFDGDDIAEIVIAYSE